MWLAILGLSAGASPSPAQAYPIFATPSVDASSILGSFLRSQGAVPGNPPDPSAANATYWQAAARHAHAFSTYWGTGYLLEAYDAQHGYSVCRVLPDDQTGSVPDHGGWVGGCATGSNLTDLAARPEMVPDPTGVEFVQLIPTGTTAVLIDRDGRRIPVPTRNGALSVHVDRRTLLQVRTDGSTSLYQLDPGLDGCSGQLWGTTPAWDSLCPGYEQPPALGDRGQLSRVRGRQSPLLARPARAR